MSKVASASILERFKRAPESMKSNPYISPPADIDGLANRAVLLGHSQFLFVVGETRFVNEDGDTPSRLNEVV